MALPAKRAKVTALSPAQRIQASLTHTCITPRLRAICCLQLHAAGVAEPLPMEQQAYGASGGALGVYMPTVQEVTARPTMDVDTLAAWCTYHADCDLVALNANRNALLDTINQADFKCPEVEGDMAFTKACPKCRSTDLMAQGRQTRSADEGDTIFYTCRKCETEFR